LDFNHYIGLLFNLGLYFKLNDVIGKRTVWNQAIPPTNSHKI